MSERRSQRSRKTTRPPGSHDARMCVCVCVHVCVCSCVCEDVLHYHHVTMNQQLRLGIHTVGFVCLCLFDQLTVYVVA